MGKKKKAKAKVEETPDKVPETSVQEQESEGLTTVPEFSQQDIKAPEPFPEKEDTAKVEPEKDPEPVSKLVVPDTELFGDKVEDAGMEKVPEGMVKIPCECINCKNKFDLYVPKGIGTSILYYRDCEKCR